MTDPKLTTLPESTATIVTFPAAPEQPRARRRAQRKPDEGVSLTDFYAYMPASHAYLFVPTRDLWPAASVNARVPPIRHGSKTILASQWLEQNRAVEQMTWIPGEPMLIENRLVAEGGWIVKSGVRTFNLYRPPVIVPGDSRAAKPWLDHVTKVYGEDSQHIISWLAQRVQHPAAKINHSLFLGGAQGVGKDTLLAPIKIAIGPWNFVDVTPHHMLGRFNGFVQSVILRVSEARDLGDIDRFAFYDHMKLYTAAPPDVIRCDQKNLREFAVFNVCGVIITSNHKTDGIFLTADDRRHFVAWSPLTKEDFDDNYWRTLWRWYETGGYGHVTAYLRELDLSAFDPKAPPPKTLAFWEIVDSNRAPEDSEVDDAIDDLGRPLVITLNQLRAHATPELVGWLVDRKNARRVPHRMESCGYTAVRNESAKDGRWKIDGRRQLIYGRADLSIRERTEAALRLTGAR